MRTLSSICAVLIVAAVFGCSSSSPVGLSDLAKNVGAKDEYMWPYEYEPTHEWFSQRDSSQTRSPYVRIEGSGICWTEIPRQPGWLLLDGRRRESGRA